MAELITSGTMVEIYPIDNKNPQYPFGKIVIELNENGYKNYATFIVKSQKLLPHYDKLKLNAQTEVKFNLKGNKKEGNGSTSYYCSNEAYFIKQG